MATTATLTFTPANWNVAQMVAVTGVDDLLDDEDQVSTVTVAVVDASSDDAFDGVADQTVSVTTTDNESPAERLLSIDIEPDLTDNEINLKSGGHVAVAILSTQDFNAVTQVDVLSLTFGRTGNERSLVLHGSKAKPTTTVRDVNGDGLADLIVNFEIRKTGFVVGDTEGILRGRILNEGVFAGRDFVTLVFPGRSNNVEGLSNDRHVATEPPASQTSDDDGIENEEKRRAAIDLLMAALGR